MIIKWRREREGRERTGKLLYLSNCDLRGDYYKTMINEFGL